MVSLLLPNLVLADGVSIDIDENGKLIYSVDDTTITYEEAYKNYGVSYYISLNLDDGTHYYYQGNEISESVYNDGIDEETTNSKLEEYGDYGIRVKTTDEVINTIKNLYDEYKNGDYYLVYSNKDSTNIDFDYIDKYVLDNYVVDSNTNIYTFTKSGIYYYPKSVFTHEDNVMKVSVDVILTASELDKLNTLANQFKKDFGGLSDYEKILAVYTYISKTVKCTTCGTDNTELVNNISAYNSLINRDSGCIGNANAFAFLMDALGVEAYVADNTSVNEDTIVSTHTFNVVKLDGQYYIIDIKEDSYDGFLINNQDNITLSNGIVISDSNYNYSSLDITIDYNKYEKLVNSLIASTQQEESLKNKSEAIAELDLLSYVILVLILLLVGCIIIIFTRKKRK